jgi:hypothetical protein
MRSVVAAWCTSPQDRGRRVGQAPRALIGTACVVCRPDDVLRCGERAGGSRLNAVTAPISEVVSYQPVGSKEQNKTSVRVEDFLGPGTVREGGLSSRDVVLKLLKHELLL